MEDERLEGIQLVGASVPELWKDMPYPWDTMSLDEACIDAHFAKEYYERLSWWQPFRKLKAHHALFKALRKVQLIAENRSRIVVGRMFDFPMKLKLKG